MLMHYKLTTCVCKYCKYFANIGRLFSVPSLSMQILFSFRKNIGLSFLHFIYTLNIAGNGEEI